MQRLADSASDSRALRVGLVELLRRQMPVDWYVAALTDPRTAVGVDPVAVVPAGIRLPELVRARYLSAHHRWTTLTGAVTLGEDPGASLVWREVQAAYGVRDVLSTVLRDDHGTWGFLDLWSSERFTEDDVALLDVVGPVLCVAVRRHQAGALRPVRAAPAAGPVVLVLEDDLRVVDATPMSAAWLATLLPPAAGARPVPAVAWNVAAQLHAVEAGIDDGEPSGRVHLADGVWVTARAARLGSGRRIAVSMAPTTGADRIDLLVRACALTPREAAVTEEVCAGGTNAEVAAGLHLSPLTVQDHLKAVFTKTGVRSRGALAALALGVPRPH